MSAIKGNISNGRIIFPFWQMIAWIWMWWTVKFSLHKVHVFRQVPEEKRFPRACPVVFVCNHVTDADGWIMLRETIAKYRRNFVGVADKALLKHMPFYRHFGVVSVGEDPFLTAKTFAGIRKIAKKNIAVTYFPQGRFYSQEDQANTRFTEGIVSLIKMFGTCIMIPVGFYYYSFAMARHSASVYFGQAQTVTDDTEITAEQLFASVMGCVDSAKRLTPTIAPWWVELPEAVYRQMEI